LVLVALLGRRAGAGPERAEAAKRELEGKRKETLVKASRRHVEVGIWCRDAGMVSQASAEFVRAVEVSEGQDAWAVKILDLMRKLDDAFWKKNNKRPGRAMLRTYENKAARAEEAFVKDRLALARWAAKKDELAEESFQEYVAVVRILDQPIVVDATGKVVVGDGPLPDAVSKRMLAEAITINEKKYVRDAFLARMPEVKEIREAECPELRVRTDGPEKEAQDLLAIARAILPLLEEDTGGRPTRRMGIYVFHKRADYEAYLDRSGLASHKAATGVADGATFVTLVCAEGLDETSLRGVALHEMSHLFQYGVTPVVMPSWYSEGFAETYGGEGTFSWDGTKIVAAGLMSKGRLEPLSTPEGFIPLEKMLSSDALTLINENRASASVFYAQSWAFRRFLRTGAGADVAERFALWEMMCRGAALGAEAGKPNGGSATPAADLFRTTFAKDLPSLEAGFKTWLKTL
jgi:hypothetical protein